MKEKEEEEEEEMQESIQNCTRAGAEECLKWKRLGPQWLVILATHDVSSLPPSLLPSFPPALPPPLLLLFHSRSRSLSLCVMSRLMLESYP